MKVKPITWGKPGLVARDAKKKTKEGSKKTRKRMAKGVARKRFCKTSKVDR